MVILFEKNLIVSEVLKHSCPLNETDAFSIKTKPPHLYEGDDLIWFWLMKNEKSAIVFLTADMIKNPLFLHPVKTVNDNEPSETAEGLGSGIPNNMTSARK
ncbi:MAG: hypothetical protein II842_18635 [Butyrivibrio sp.]|nr:hypothetical protein [Butyrivibrio sp.]